jgi:FKBP-type peptidyl-prolyl cis-trans isomerase FkpA
MKKYFYLFFSFVVLLFSCDLKKKDTQLIKGYSFSPNGYHYQMISFTDGSLKPKVGDMLWLDVVFKNLKDSVFWDSEHDVSGKFFFKMEDNADKDPFLKHIYNLAEGDSMAFYLNTKRFFKLYFKSDSIPFFCKNDSMVKADLKLKKVLDEKDFEEITIQFQNREKNLINDYFVKNNISDPVDSLGIYWLEHQPTSDAKIEPGQSVSFSYKGYFLDGKLIDYSSPDFTYVYGTPDQVLKGLNCVIGRLKKGEFVKIILSSHLAYGKTGSSNGTVPPFTPLLYEIKIIEVK